ncbi:MAG: SEC-C metal-binding domain-containing protein, partial [Acidimicrobiales bacterium]
EVLESALSDVVESYCPDDVEDWNLDGLLAETKLYYPSKFSVADLAEAVGPGQIHESLLAEATEFYEQREVSVNGGSETMRQVERQVMLQLIDQKWREHLSEMDYLREGIGLRAMGQQDPLVAWQKEGYSMFGNLISSIDDDFVKYAMHVDVVIEEPEEPDLSHASLEGPAEPVQSLGGSEAAHREAALVAQEARQEGAPPPPAAEADLGETIKPKVKSEHEKVGRNDPCWCASGKKYKHCHGR